MCYTITRHQTHPRSVPEFEMAESHAAGSTAARCFYCIGLRLFGCLNSWISTAAFGLASHNNQDVHLGGLLPDYPVDAPSPVSSELRGGRITTLINLRVNTIMRARAPRGVKVKEREIVTGNPLLIPRKHGVGRAATIRSTTQWVWVLIMGGRRIAPVVWNTPNG